MNCEPGVSERSDNAGAESPQEVRFGSTWAILDVYYFHYYNYVHDKV
jgi:hypothetical protein